MSCELTPKVVTRTYPAQAPEVRACDYLQEWKACECCPNGFEGYDNTDGPYTYCLNGTLMIATPLTAEKNCDDPQRGSQKVTPTWRLETSEQHARRIAKEAADAAVAAIPDGQTLNSCAGVEHPTGTRVPTCAELDVVDAKANAAAAAAAANAAAAVKLKNLNDEDLVTGQQVVARNNLNGGDFTIDPNGDLQVNFPAIPSVPEYSDCNGTAVTTNTPIVTCANFPDQFDALLQDSCLDIQELSADCGNVLKVAAVECAGGGGYKLRWYNDDSTKRGSGGFNAFTTNGQLWPADNTSGSDLAIYDTVDNEANTSGSTFTNLPQATQDKLLAHEICATIDNPCTDPIMFTFAGTPALATAADSVIRSSRWIYTVDGEFQFNAAGDLLGLPAFTNYQGAYSENVTFSGTLVGGGSHTICFYLVQSSPNNAPAQMSIRNANNVQRPIWSASAVVG